MTSRNTNQAWLLAAGFKAALQPRLKPRLRLLYGAMGLTLSLLAMTPLSSCKAFDSKKSSAPVRESNPNDLPPMEGRAASSDAAAAFMRPAASLPGAAVLMIGDVRLCLVTRVAENFLLTAASCVFDPLSGYPKPPFLYSAKLGLGWRAGDEQKIIEVTSAAVYAHESYLKHFSATKGKPSRETYSDRAALAQVADLALIEFRSKETDFDLPVATLAEGLPPLDASGKAPVVALHGFCGIQSEADIAAKKTPNYIDGGRSLAATLQADTARGYITDVFKSTRALFDCEGFRGAPVSVEGSSAVVGVTSWMHEGSTERGVTWVAGDATKPGTIKHWIVERIKAKRDFQAPVLTTAVSCRRQVSTSIGTFDVEFANWPVLFDDKRIVVSNPTFDLDLTITAAPADQKKEGVQPLALESPEATVKQKYKMLRDVRQAGFMQFVSAEKLTLGKEDITVTLVSTDGETALIVIAAEEQGKSPRDRKERSVNVFLETFDGKWCNRKTVAAP